MGKISRKNLNIWRTVRVGLYKTKDVLLGQLEEQKTKVGAFARLALAEHPLEQQERTINLAVVSHGDLGFSKGASFRSLCRAAADLGLTKMPMEAAAPLIAVPDVSMPRLVLASDPIVGVGEQDEEDETTGALLTIENRPKEEWWLLHTPMRPHRLLRGQFVFLLP